MRYTEADTLPLSRDAFSHRLLGTKVVLWCEGAVVAKSTSISDLYTGVSHLVWVTIGLYLFTVSFLLAHYVNFVWHLLDTLMKYWSKYNLCVDLYFIVRLMVHCEQVYPT